MTESSATAGLTMRGEKRAADPRTLFRPGSKSIGELSRAIPVPVGIPPRDAPEFRMDAFLTGVEYATSAAKSRARHQPHSPSSGHFLRAATGFTPPGAHPQNSARVAGTNSRPLGASGALVEGVSSRDCRGASRVPALSGP